jgi:hypothetical protein
MMPTLLRRRLANNQDSIAAIVVSHFLLRIWETEALPTFLKTLSQDRQYTQADKIDSPNQIMTFGTPSVPTQQPVGTSFDNTKVGTEVQAIETPWKYNVP